MLRAIIGLSGWRAGVMAGFLVACWAGRPDAELSASAQKGKKEAKRPTLSVRASPMMAFAPARIFVTAELKGGPDDYEEYYCPTIEWEWGDLTKSQSTLDCDPYEAGKSEIRRRFSAEHIFRTGGTYRIEIRLKRKDKVLTASNLLVQIRAGVNEPPLFGY